MSLVNSTMRVAALLSVVPFFGGVAPRSVSAHHATHVARAQQPESPAFGLVPVGANQSVRLNVLCFMHQVGSVPPGPCRGTVMVHDVAGAILTQGTYDLKPGETAHFEYRRPPTDVAGRILIDPCWIPDAGGRVVPSVEVFDNVTGRTALYVNPAAARTSEFGNGRIVNPGSLVGFNPQPDPPGFGVVKLVSGQGIRTNVWCSAHGIGNTPPDPCRGTVMFHDAAGNLLQSSSYALKPGEGGVFTLVLRVGDDRLGGFIIPCVIPSEGGRAVPDVEVFDQDGTALLINPAVSRMSQFDQ